MSIKCGNCKGKHDLPDEVRACYKMNGETGLRPKDEAPVWPASDKQVNYLLALQEERLLPAYWQPMTEEQVRQLDRDEASGTIALLTTFAKKPGATTGGGQTKWTMPEGRYAIKVEAGPGVGTGKWAFFEISKPTEGRWAGYTFIQRLIGAPGTYRKEKMSAPERTKWLNAIEANPKQAMIDYGLESGHCGRCSSPLTDPESLARGLGPVCAGKSGWF